MEWKIVEPDVWKPEKEGDSIEGVLIRVERGIPDKDISSRYYIENTSGRFLVWGSAVLDDRLNLINVGALIKITYGGKGKNKKKQDLKLFKVFVADDTPKVTEEKVSD